MYTYEIVGTPPMCRVKKGSVTVDYSGPWESVESAETWASMYVNALNEEIIAPEEPS